MMLEPCSPRRSTTQSGRFRGDGLIDCPAALKSSPHGVVFIEREPFDQFRNWCRHAVERMNAVAAGVSALLKRCGPSAVPRLVVATGILAVNLLSDGALPHVSEEVFKLHPPLTHLDPSPSIEVVITTVGVKASLFHFNPDAVGWRFGEAMGFVSKALQGFGKTATGLSATQRTGSYPDNLTANALTPSRPKWMTLGIEEWFGGSDDREACKTISGMNNDWRHNSVLLCSVTGARLQPALVTIMHSVG